MMAKAPRVLPLDEYAWRRKKLTPRVQTAFSIFFKIFR